jgi:uncharacterized protein (TIGR00730 family)
MTTLKNIKNVTVFGSARVEPGQPLYQEAYRLGSLLAQAGCTVLTGGYIGTMEAVSQGAAEAGGHVVGVTCEDIERWRPVKCNPWVTEERRFPTLRERLMALIDSCEAAIALPGGPGTLAEVALTWNQVMTGAISPRPLVLIGPGWRETFEVFYRHMDAYIPLRDRGFVAFAEDVDAAVNLVLKKS